jgi:hypothetical protein
MPSTETTKELKDITNSLYFYIKLQHDRAFNLIWKNEKYTPEEMVTELGEDARVIFEMSSDLQSLLKKANPKYDKLMPTKKVKLNNDGTVTLG